MVKAAVLYLKIPAAIALLLFLFHPPLPPVPSMGLIGAMSIQSMEVQRQADSNTTRIAAMERRLDLIEAMHIDASIASMKATIDYDHSLLMYIAGAVFLMLISNFVGFFKTKKQQEDE